VFYGRDYKAPRRPRPALNGLPVIAGHNNYYLWGPKGFDCLVVIVLDGDAVRR
jgi:hypothetical protein